jgi:hypothetical protein
MRTTPAPPVIAFPWTLLAPVLALAQSARGAEPGVNHGALFWFWLLALALAFGFFIWRTAAMARRRGGPPLPPRMR